MKALHNFIIEPLGGKLYSNKRDIGGVEITVSTDIEDHRVTNREAVVLSTPIGYSGPISEGDMVVVHHNVFRKYYNMKGEESFASTLLRDGTYTAGDLEVFAYRQSKDQDWVPIDPYCFIEPVPNDENGVNSSLKRLHGTMRYSNDYLSSKGVLPGSTVCFEEDSEYEFHLDGIKLYRVKSKSVCLKMN